MTEKFSDSLFPSVVALRHPWAALYLVILFITTVIIKPNQTKLSFVSQSIGAGYMNPFFSFCSVKDYVFELNLCKENGLLIRSPRQVQDKKI